MPTCNVCGQEVESVYDGMCRDCRFEHEMRNYVPGQDEVDERVFGVEVRQGEWGERI